MDPFSLVVFGGIALAAYFASKKLAASVQAGNLATAADKKKADDAAAAAANDAAKVARNAKNADDVFGSALTVTAGALALEFPKTAPYIGAATGIVAGIWKSLPPKTKSDIWEGKT